MQTSYLDLEEQAAKLLKQAEELRLQERAATITSIKDQITKYGLTADELGLSPQAKHRNAPPAPAKYKGPNGELWSGGRGRRPDWIRKAVEEGRSIEDFAIRQH